MALFGRKPCHHCAEQERLLREIRDELRVVRVATIKVDGRMKLTQEDGREIVRELRRLGKMGISV